MKYLLNLEHGRAVACSLDAAAARTAAREAVSAERRAKSQQSDEGRICLTCGTWKPWSCFTRDPRRASGKTSNCMECAYWRTVKSIYGITRAEWEWLRDNQDGCCALCHREDQSKLAVDHDHACCGKSRACKKCIRGMLCRTCNRMLGHVESKPRLATRFADYLALRPFTSGAPHGE